MSLYVVLITSELAVGGGGGVCSAAYMKLHLKYCV